MKANIMTSKFTKLFTLLACSMILLFPSAHAQALPNISPEIMNYGMIALIFLVMYFLVIRPQSKKAKLHQQMLTALRRGDQVLTAGGIIGTVQKIDNEQEVHVEIAEGVRVRIAKATIVQVLAKTEPLKTTLADSDGDEITTLDNLDDTKDIKPSKVTPRTTSSTRPKITPKGTIQSRKRTTKPK